jgi:hypothetical protein
MSDSECVSRVLETLVLAELDSGNIMTVDELMIRLPQLTFGELFLTIDTLSRRGQLFLRRRGFEYEVWLPKGAASMGAA